MKKIIPIALCGMMLFSAAACGECVHTFENGICTQCEEACTHNFKNGECTVCELPCTHDYKDGVCIVCGIECTHNYVEGVCSVCEQNDPTYVPADGGVSLYDEIINNFEYLVRFKDEFATLPQRVEGEPEYFNTLYAVLEYYGAASDIGHALKDINGDGWKELLIMDPSCYISAIFTIVDRQPVTAGLFPNFTGHLGPDGLIYYVTYKRDDQGRQIGNYRHMKYLVNGELVGYEYGYYDVDEVFDTEGNLYYVKYDGEEAQYVTEEEFDYYVDTNDYYWSYATRVSREAGLFYQPVYSYLINPTLPTVDFSTIDSVIQTYTDMYEYAATSTSYYKKTDWTGGDYDTCMNFASDEDYYLYQRLLCAITTINRPTSSTTYGYALKDLNGDNVDELILLDSNFTVFAIFTEVDGKAVLLDIFSDWRSAWIDEDGLVHVKDKTVPGHKKDYTYSVYTIENGNYVSTLTLGIGYESSVYDAVANRWYQVVNGEEVELEQAAWETLYADWELDLEDLKFHEYTQQNAGLTLVSIHEESAE